MLGKLIDRSNGGCYFIAAKLLIDPASELPRADVVDTSTETVWSRFAASRRGMMFLLAVLRFAPSRKDGNRYASPRKGVNSNILCERLTMRFGGK
jgi:hypothetical protein